MNELIHWSNDASWTVCGKKIAVPYIAYQGTPDGKRLGEIRLQQMFKPKYVLEAAKLNDVNCPCCIAVMKKSKWYCIYHDFIHGIDVTFEETCNICYNPV